MAERMEGRVGTANRPLPSPSPVEREPEGQKLINKKMKI